MNVVIVGANGQLGTDIVRVFSDSTVIAMTNDDIEITDIDSVERAFAGISPDLVINTASFVNVELSEKDPETSFRVNEVGALNLARLLEPRKIPLAHISTDYVFDGAKRAPYVETDLPNPLNVYGKSKLAGERAIQANSTRYFIIRTSGLYGHNKCIGKGANFIEKILARSKEHDELRVVDDEILTPTYTLDLAFQIRDLVKTGEHGMYHATNNGWCSWFEFAGEVFRHAGISTRLIPITSSEFPSPVRRPLYSVLENAALTALGMDKMPHWKESLATYFGGR